MSEHDRALLLAFCEHVSKLAGMEGVTDEAPAIIDAWLAARAQPDVSPRCVCGHQKSSHGVGTYNNVTCVLDDCDCTEFTLPCPHNRPPGECAECDGGSSPEMENEPCDSCVPDELCHACQWNDKPPAPPAERFWRVVEEPTSLAGSMPVFHAYECDADGMMGRVERKRLSATDRPARAEAEADGVASGLRPWKGGGK